jgi:dTDP-glucose 4,6-dehydratase
VDLSDAEATAVAVRQADPDLVLHLGAESHADRSIEGPAAYGSTSRHSRVMPTAVKLQAGYRLALSLEADGLRLIPQDPAKTSAARALIGCTGYQGPALELEAMDPACF